MAQHGHDTHWISLSDMMTSLMIVFLFIAVSYMFIVQSKVEAHEQTKGELYEDLRQTFADKMTEWSMTLDEKTLTIKFDDPSEMSLFDKCAPEANEYFATVLNEFIPKYLETITKDKYATSISEVRIQGHTAASDVACSDTMKLSQQRASGVLDMVRSHRKYRDLSQEKQEWLAFRMSASGFGEGRALNTSGAYVIDSSDKVISAISRRVEFRIVTSTEGVLEEINKTLSNN